MASRAVTIIGLGFHCRKVHYPTLEAAAGLEVQVPLVVDILPAEGAIRSFLSAPDRTVVPRRVALLPAHHMEDDSRHLDLGVPVKVFAPSRPNRVYSSTLGQELRAVVGCTGTRAGTGAEQPTAAVPRGPAQSALPPHILISSDDRSHLRYTDYWLGCGVAAKILVDKPVSAPNGLCQSPAAAGQLEADFIELLQRTEEGQQPERGTVDVLVQRRYHDQVEHMLATLDQFVGEWQVPVTSIAIEEADGKWVMPHEWDIPNHTYAAGHGKLLHSGYHMLDLWGQLVAVNNRLADASLRPQYAATNCRAVRAHDASRFVGSPALTRLFGSDHLLRHQPPHETLARTFGETDAVAAFQVYGSTAGATTGAGGPPSGPATAVTSSTLSLLHNSLSTRAFQETPEDLYKGCGRTKHERVVVQCGPLLMIESQRTDVHAHGQYVVRTFRNPLIGGKPREEASFSLNFAGATPDDHGAKRVALLEWLRDGRTRTPLSTQLVTIRALAAMYRSIQSGTGSQETFDFHRR